MDKNSSWNRFLIILLSLILPAILAGQSDVESHKKKKVGQSSLTVDAGLFWCDTRSVINPNFGFIVGLEKRRHRLIAGPTFGEYIFYSEPNRKFGLTGFLADYTFIFLHPIKQFDLAVFTQFQYNFQERDIYYKPPAETLIFSSRYRESIYGLFGLEPRVNILKSLQIFAKFGIGIEWKTSQVYYPYMPPNGYHTAHNRYSKNNHLTEFIMFGISYGFSKKNKLLEE